MRSVDHPEHLRLLIDEAVFGVVEADGSGRILYANAAWCSMLGYSAEELRGKTVFDITHPSSLESTRALIARLVGGQRSGAVAKRYVRRDGSLLHARSNLGARFDETGKLETITAFIVDQSEQVAALEKAERAEERLTEALSIGRMIAWEWDLESQTLLSSSDPSAFWGVTINSPADFLTVVHGEDRERVAHAMREDASQVPSEITYRTIAADGTVRHIHSHRRVDRGADGRPTVVRGIASDVTHTVLAMQATQALAEASATLGASLDYQLTLESLARVFVPGLADWYAIDLLGATGELERVAVYHADPVKIELGRQLHDRHPPRRDSDVGPWQALRTGEASWLCELTEDMLRQGAESAEHYELLQKLALRSFICVPLIARGRPIGVLTLAHAESGRRYRQKDVDLAKQIAERAAVAVDNAQLYGALQDADHRKNEFLAMLAHELRNPLAPIRTAADVLQVVAPDNPPVKRAADIIRRQVGHMTELVDDLIDVSRVTRGLVELQRKPVDLRSVVAAALEQVQVLAESRGHSLSADVTSEPVWVPGDHARLIQVLVNLLTNAAKYTPFGGRIELTVETDTHQVRIEVRDNGIGIEPALLPHVFELFTQAERTPDRSQGGLGIGLALVRTIVELHGGEVRARSAGHGQGSTFTVRLPRLTGGAAENDQSPTEKPAGARRILVVDDNEDAAQMASMLLAAHGHNATVAYNATDCLKVAAAEGPFDAYVLDIGLPDMTGYDLAQALSSLSPTARLVALTGYGQDEDRKRASEAGFHTFLVKPADAAGLLKSIS